MNERLPIKPSPALLAATRRALAILARHWPQKFKAVHGGSEDAEAFVADYAKACAYVPLDCLEDAAHAWVVRSKFAPSPAEFGDIARELRPPRLDTPVGRADVPPPPKDIRTVDQLGGRAFARLGSWRLVGEVWGLLWLTAPTPDERAMVQAGDIPLEMFDEAVAKIAAGYRPASGPLGGLVA